MDSKKQIIKNIYFFGKNLNANLQLFGNHNYLVCMKRFYNFRILQNYSK